MTQKATIYRIEDLPSQSGHHMTLRAFRAENVMVTFVTIDPTDDKPVHGLHRHPYDQMILVTEGTCIMHIDGADHRIPTGSAIIVPANLWHTGWAAGKTPAKIMEILAPIRNEYLHLTKQQSEKFKDEKGADWFATPADRHADMPA